MPLRLVESLQQVLLKHNLYICGEAGASLPQAINLNWISEKRISLEQFKRQSSCYYNFNVLKLWLFTRHALPSTLSSLPASFFLFPKPMSIYNPMLWHEGTLERLQPQ